MPIVNENDTTATNEIRYGDNDRLAARVAQITSSDTLVMLSDIDGLYTKDPKKFKNAKHIREVKTITDKILKAHQKVSRIMALVVWLPKLRRQKYVWPQVVV